MTNLIVASFNDEAKAIEASKKLTELDSLGDITIYERVIVRKNPNGETVVLQQTESTDGLRTVSGMAIGSLVGALAGPVGMMLGMLTGTMVGAVSDSDHYDFADDFASRAAGQLKPGTVAIIAEVNEDNEIFINDSLKALNAVVTRTDVDYEYDKFSDEQIDAFDEEIAEERAEIKSANAAEKAKIQKRIAELKDKRRKRITELKEKMNKKAEHIQGTFRDRKADRLRHRIEKYQTKIEVLKHELEDIAH